MPELERLKAALFEAGGGGGTDHLSDEQWERLACDELGPDERRLALDHVVACPECSRIHRALLVVRREAAGFDDRAPAPDPTPASTEPPRWASWRTVGLVAMAATVILAVVLPLRRDHEPVVDPDAVRLRGVEDGEAPRPVAPLDEVRWRAGDDLVLEWTPAAAERPARAEVLDADGELVWSSPPTTAVRTLWPAERIPGPGSFYWRVVARDPGAGEVASELVSFELLTASPP